MIVAPGRNRAKWNALETINRSTWAGSAAFGGFLVQRYGYGAAFLVSAAFVAASISVLSGLLAVEALGKPPTPPPPPGPELELGGSTG